MRNLKHLIQRLRARKLSLTAVILVAVASAVAGAFAAIAVNTTTYNFTGEAGTFHQSSGTFTITDNGLLVAANTFTSNESSTLTIGSGSAQVQTAIAPGNWVESVSFHMGTPATGSHIATVKIQNGGGTVAGTTIATFTSGAWTTSSGSTGTVTCYVDTGQTSLTSPITIYASIT